jgi:hypothetical protein
MRILILASLTAATGNEVTVRRLEGLFRDGGHAVRVEDSNPVRARVAGKVNKTRVSSHRPGPQPSPPSPLSPPRSSRPTTSPE